MNRPLRNSVGGALSNLLSIWEIGPMLYIMALVAVGVVIGGVWLVVHDWLSTFTGMRILMEWDTNTTMPLFLIVQGYQVVYPAINRWGLLKKIPSWSWITGVLFVMSIATDFATSAVSLTPKTILDGASIFTALNLFRVAIVLILAVMYVFSETVLGIGVVALIAVIGVLWSGGVPDWLSHALTPSNAQAFVDDHHPHAQQPTQHGQPQRVPEGYEVVNGMLVRKAPQQPVSQPVLRPASQINRPVTTNTQTFRPAPKPAPTQQTFVPPEPTYHPVNYTGRTSGGQQGGGQQGGGQQGGGQQGGGDA